MLINGGTFNGKTFATMTEADWQVFIVDYDATYTNTIIGTDPVVISR